MREDILNWEHKKGDDIWEPFLDLFESAPVSNEEFERIIENSSENVERHRKSRYDPVRKCLNSIYDKEKFAEIDLTEIDNSFLNGKKKINFKAFLSRVEKYPMSQETFDRLIDSPNTTGDFDESKQDYISKSQRIINIAYGLHQQGKFIQISYEKVLDDLEKRITKSKNDNPNIRKDRLNQACKTPEKIHITSVGFRRNPDVITEVLSRANGVCEECNKNAPFIRKKDNTPYLEVHHKVMLSDGGEDTIENAIAVCPNCHRELHFG